MKLLLDYGADVNAKTKNGSTPLLAASAKGNLEVVRLLRDKRGAYAPTPSHSEIESWWAKTEKQGPYDELDIKDVKPVRLKSGEQAFLASVWFPTRGHCCGGGILIVRPALQKVRQIDPRLISVYASVSELIDLDDRITGVVISGSMTAQGYTTGVNTFLYFDDWNPIVIHSQGFENNFGEVCGKAGPTGRPCHSEEIYWTFTDLDGDGAKDLVELIVNANGDEPDQMTIKTQINAYLIKDKQPVPFSAQDIPQNVQEKLNRKYETGDRP